MNMPITIVITLFVAFVIGGAIVGFSTESFNSARTEMAHLVQENDQTERIFEVQQVSDASVAGLADACYKEMSASVIEDSVCAVVLGEVRVSESGIKKHSQLDEDQLRIDVSGASNAVRIKYSFAFDAVVISA